MRDNHDTFGDPEFRLAKTPALPELTSGEPHRDVSTAPTSETLYSASASSGDLSQQSLTFGLSSAGKEDHDPLVGVTVGDVTIDRLLAEGGMGRVYLGTQQRPSRSVAIKFMRHGRSATSLERFRREAEVLGRLSHPAIARVFFTGSLRIGLDDVPFTVMEYVPNADTFVRFCNRNSLSLSERLVLFLQVCHAVAYGHAQGVVHRDLKPSNILVTNHGGQSEPRVSVIDYGIAKTLTAEGQEGVTETGEFLGTRQYMSPEQLAGSHDEIDARTDVYALGVVLHEILTGKHPYDLAGCSLAETINIVSRTRPHPLELSEKNVPSHQRQSLRRIASRCIEKHPGNRYAGAAGLAEDIRKLLDGITIPKRPSRRPVAGLLLTAAAALAALGLFTLQTSGEQRFSGLKPFVSQKLTANFNGMPAKRSSPLNWVMVTFSSPVEELDLTGFRLTRNAAPVSLSDVTLTRLEPRLWKLEGLASANEQQGDYTLTLLAGDDSPSDVSRQPLSEAVSTRWTMIPTSLAAVNTSSPPALIGQLPSLASTGRVMLSPDGRKAAVNADIGQLCFIDVQSPEAMQLVSEFRSVGLGAFRDFAWSPDGTKLFAVSHEQAGGLHIIDVSDYSAPSQLAFYKTPDYAHEVCLSPDGKTVFIADGNTGLLALDVQRPDAPAHLGQLNLSTFVQGITLSSDGRLGFLPCFKDGLTIVDVSDPTRMLRVGHVSLPGNAWRITRSPTAAIVYVITRQEGFFVVDVSNPAVPRVLAEVTRQANIDRLVISSDHQRMHATVRHEGIWSFDISAPASPRLLGTQRISGRPIDVAVTPSTDTAFVAALDRGLLAVQLGEMPSY